VMGILNITPDSFSDGGAYNAPAAALRHAEQLLAEGADLLDVGGESTRPGASPVSEPEERERVLPVIREVRRRFPEVPISIDTFKAGTAAAAIDAGADLINDVWGAKHGMSVADLRRWEGALRAGESLDGVAGSPIADVAASRGAPCILMHNRAKPEYRDFWDEVLFDLRVSIALARGAGVPDHQIWLDPGFGFGKNPGHNLEVLKHLDRVSGLGYPVLLGTSRKSTIGRVLDRPVMERGRGTAATLVWGIAHGCRMVRLHDVEEHRDAVAMADAIREGMRYA